MKSNKAASMSGGGNGQTYDLVIAGGGFAGLALGLALSQTFDGDMRIAVVDPGPLGDLARGSKALPADARAIALAAASQRLLASIGIWDDLAAHAQPVTGIDITDSSLDDGIRPVLLRYDNVLHDGAAGTYILENARLLDALHKAAGLAATAVPPKLTLIDGVRVLSAVADVAGANVTLADGRMLRTSLVVASDGRKSPLRESAGIKTVGWTYGQTGIVATVAHEIPHEGRAVQHFLPSGPFAILPLPGNRSCITWSEQADEAKRILALDDAGFLAEADRRFGGRLGRIALDGPRQSWPLDLQLARDYTASRLVLVGDAAHGVHPIAGQGLNLGLRDVAALAEVIADAARLGQDIGHATILDRYTRWRRPDSVASAAAYDGLNRLFSNDSRILRTGRDAGLGIVDRIPALKRALVAEAAGLTGSLPRLLQGQPL
jgi:2-octaprenyl-6-methoxyphenol hydroxylase